MAKNGGIILGLISSIFILLGSLLPWGELKSLYFEDYIVSGIEGDGVFTLILSIITIGLLAYVYFNQSKKNFSIIGFIILMISFIIGGLAINVSSNLWELNPLYEYYGVHTGSGLIVTEIGAFLLFISSIILMVTVPKKKVDDKKDRYCPNCGRRIPFNANFCPYCQKNFRTFGEEK